MQGKSPSGEPAKQLAIEGVRRAILQGELVAGQRLIEPDLAEMLGINRSSVRATKSASVTSDQSIHPIVAKRSRLPA